MGDPAHDDERRQTRNGTGEEPNRVTMTSEQHQTLLKIDP
jgi:hypothetical protein